MADPDDALLSRRVLVFGAWAASWAGLAAGMAAALGGGWSGPRLLVLALFASSGSVAVARFLPGKDDT